MTPRDDPDLANLPRFLDHLGERDAGAAALARQLLDEGWTIRSFWGPVQMDVWSLGLRRGGREVVFGVERGFPDAVRLGPARDDARYDDFHPLTQAVLGWARSVGADVELGDPERFHVDLGAYGAQALDWLDAGNDDVLDRIRAAWDRYWRVRHGPDQRRDAAWLAQVKAWGLREIEAAAASQAE